MPDRHLLTPRTLDDMLLYAMWHLQTSAGQVVTRVVEGEFGVTRRQWRVLALLATHEGVLSSQLAERSGLDRAQTSRALTLLADKGLVERTPRPSDRREVLLHLSEAGRALYAALLPRIIEINRQLLSTLRADEVLALEGFLQRLQRQAEAMNTPMRRTQQPP